MRAEGQRAGDTPLVARWLERPVSWLRPGGARDGREAYQLRFLAGAIVLAAGVSVLVLIVAMVLGHWLGFFITACYLALILLQALAVRLGAAVSVVAWTIIATVGLFLLVNAFVPSANQSGQLYWFLLIPLAARALAVQRHDAPDAPPAWRAEIVAGVVALAAVVLVIVCHGTQLSGAPHGPNAVAIHLGIDVALFLLSVLGLLYVHDLSVRETAAELRRLRQLLSMCAWCRDIRHNGQWISVEDYIEQQQGQQLTHGMCPTCYNRHWNPNQKSDA